MSLSRRLARHIFGKWLPRWAYPVVRGSLAGQRFYLGAAAGEGGGASVHLGLMEVAQSHALEKLLRPGGVFFDVGANVGYYSLLGARCVGTAGLVVALEPVPRNVSYLYRHAELNGLAQMLIVPAACADRLGLETFVKGDNPALGHLGTATGASRAELLAATITLDLVAERLARWPTVIKIDAEGAELHVLRGAERVVEQAAPDILLSVHSSELRRDCLAFLAQRGYRVSPLDGTSIDDASEYLAQPVKRQSH